MKLEGSCHCGAVRFSLESDTPVPYQHCYCSICRKTAGASGSAVNLGGDASTLKVDGEAHVSVYRVDAARTESGDDEGDGQSPGRRHFCSRCGSALWAWDSRWPELVHPFASAIDTELPVPPERTHLMLDYKPAWVPVPGGEGDARFGVYPDESLAQWHRRHRVGR